MALIRLALAGDARATFPGGEGMGKRIATPVCGLVRNDTFYSGAPAFAMPYVIRHTLEKVPCYLLKYFARGETTKFIRPILWEMTFFASEP